MKKLLTLILASLFFFSADAQKKEQKPATDTVKVEPTIVLVGTVKNFQSLEFAITNPDDLSLNEKRAIIAWLRSARVVPPPAKERAKK